MVSRMAADSDVLMVGPRDDLKVGLLAARKGQRRVDTKAGSLEIPLVEPRDSLSAESKDALKSACLVGRMAVHWVFCWVATLESCLVALKADRMASLMVGMTESQSVAQTAARKAVRTDVHLGDHSAAHLAGW